MSLWDRLLRRGPDAAPGRRRLGVLYAGGDLAVEPGASLLEVQESLKRVGLAPDATAARLESAVATGQLRKLLIDLFEHARGDCKAYCLRTQKDLIAALKLLGHTPKGQGDLVDHGTTSRALDEGVRQMAAWRDAGPDADGVRPADVEDEA